MNLRITLLLKLGAAPSSGGATVAIYNDASITPNALIATVGRVLDTALTFTPSNVVFHWSGSLAANTRYWIGLLRDPGSAITWAISSTSTGVGVAGEYTYDARVGSVANGLPYQMLISDDGGFLTSISTELVGVSMTSEAGSLNNYQIILPSTSATFATGTIATQILYGLTGVVGTLEVGDIATPITVTTTTLTGVDMTLTAGTFIDFSKVLPGVEFNGTVGVISTAPPDALVNIELPGVIGNFAVNDLVSGLTSEHQLDSLLIQSAAGRIGPNVLYTLVGNAIGSAAGSMVSVISAEGFLMDDLLIETKPAQPDDFDVSLIYSDDKGATWSFPIEQSIGALGDYLTDLQWQRLGMGRDRVFTIQWSSPCKTSLIGVFVDVTTGNT